MRNRLWLLALMMVGCGSAADSGSSETENSSLPETSVDAQARAMAVFAPEVKASWKWTLDALSNVPAHVEGSSATALGKGITARHATVAFLTKFREEYKLSDPESSFVVAREERDELGMTHLRMQQVVRGIVVANRELTAHFDERGGLKSVDSTHAAGLESVDLNPVLTAEQATAKAMADLGATLDVKGAEVETKPELQVFAPEGGKADDLIRTP